MALVVGIVLLFLLGIIASFGAGYVLNVATKIWWLAIVGYVILVVALSLTKHLIGAGPLVWFLLAVVGLGAVLSSVAIKTLKNKGYKMFPS